MAVVGPVISVNGWTYVQTCMFSFFPPHFTSGCADLHDSVETNGAWYVTD